MKLARQLIATIITIVNILRLLFFLIMPSKNKKNKRWGGGREEGKVEQTKSEQ